MRSPFRASLVAAAMLMLIGCVPILLTSCVTSKEAQQRTNLAEQVHENAPQWFLDSWEQYLLQTRGHYGLLAVEQKLRGIGMGLLCVRL